MSPASWPRNSCLQDSYLEHASIFHEPTTKALHQGSRTHAAPKRLDVRANPRATSHSRGQVLLVLPISWQHITLQTAATIIIIIIQRDTLCLHWAQDWSCATCSTAAVQAPVLCKVPLPTHSPMSRQQRHSIKAVELMLHQSISTSGQTRAQHHAVGK